MSPEFRWHYLKTALFVTTFTSCLSVIGSQCTNNPILVPNCPGSTYDWNLLAFVFCVDAKQYHCLITENHNAANPEMIQCCMRPQNISKGHMPRYNIRKETLQEIPCEDEYYMPIQFESNRYRDNGAEHCKYKKTSCVMEGMKVFDDGSPTEDRKCYCDYLNNYKPELPLDENVSYFLERDNRCVMSKDCNTTYQELGMMYQCIDKCKLGEYRPENQMGCMPVSTVSPTTAVTISDSATKDETKTVTPPLTKTPTETTTTDTMVKPIIVHINETRDLILIIKIVVPLVVVLSVLILAVLLFLHFRKRRAEEQGIFCCTWANTFVHYHKPNNVITGNNNRVQFKNGDKSPEEDQLFKKAYVQVFEELYTKVVTSSVMLKVSVSEVDSVEWHFYPEHGQSKTLITEDSKYSIGELPHPSLTIRNISRTDSGYFFCKGVVNNGSDVESKPIKLDVKVPEIRLKKGSLKVEIGQTRTIECDILNKPEKFDIFWEKAVKNEDYERINTNKVKYEGAETDHPHLRVLKAEISDTGYYRCCLTYSTEEGEEIVKSSKTHLEVHEGKPLGNIIVDKQINTYINKVGEMNLGSHSDVNIRQVDTTTEQDDSSYATEDSSPSDGDSNESNTGTRNNNADSVEHSPGIDERSKEESISEPLREDKVISRENHSGKNLNKDDKDKFKQISPSEHTHKESAC